MTLTIDLDLSSVKKKRLPKHLSQMPFYSQVIIRTFTHTQTNGRLLDQAITVVGSRQLQ